MKSTLKKIKDCKMRMTVEVDPHAVENRFQEVLKGFQKEASLPGFRSGKAPFEMIEKKYFREAQEEVLKSLIPEAYHQSVLTQKLSPVSLPSISDIEIERGKKLTFSAEFESAPEFTLKNYKGIKVAKPPMDVLESDVDKGVQSLLESRAELIEIAEPRPVKKGDFVSADIDLWKEGAYTPGRKGVLLFVESHESDDFLEKMVGAQLEEVREILADATEEEKNQGIIGRKPAYKVWVRGIKEKKLPALDAEFAKGFGKETVDELKEAVRKDIANHKKNDSFEKMKYELFDQLLKLVNFSLPDGLVEKQKEKLLDQAKKQVERMGLRDRKMAEEMKKVESNAQTKANEQVKLYFILQRVADLEGVDVDETELEKKLERIANESERPLHEVKHVFEEDLRESMRESKTIDFLLANAKLEEETK